MNRPEIAERYKAAGELVQSAVVSSFVQSEDYIVRDLTDSAPKNPHDFKNTEAGMPLHWFGLYPAENQAPGVQAVQFGIGRPEQVRPAQELLMEIVARNGVAATTRPYEYMGGTMVGEVRKAGHDVFAAIEVNAIEISDEDILLFARLSMSSALMKTRSVFKDRNKNMPTSHMPRWAQKVARTRFSDEWKVAELLAWSAFASAGVSDVGPKYGRSREG